jgi:3D (Asp-Asp-Asp) domain-containing protein
MKRWMFMFFIISVVTIFCNIGRANAEIFKVTAYCSCEKCCDKDPSDEWYGITATGTEAHWGTVAVDPRVIELGRRLRIEGYNITFKAEDVGSAIKGNHIDVWFSNHWKAKKFGVQYLELTWTM